MGYRGAVRVFEIARDSSKGKWRFPTLLLPPLLLSRTLRTYTGCCYLPLACAVPNEALYTIEPRGSKVTVAAWTALDEFIVTGHEDGSMNLWDSVRCSSIVFCPLSVHS